MKNLVLAFALVGATSSFAAFNPEQEFSSKCVMCHTLGAQAVGPDLKKAIPAAKKALGKKADAYFVKFINNSAETVVADAYAKKTYPTPMKAMPPQNYTADQVAQLVKWIESK